MASRDLPLSCHDKCKISITVYFRLDREAKGYARVSISDKKYSIVEMSNLFRLLNAVA